MADIITGTTTGFVNSIPEQTLASVSDVRREQAEHTNEIVKEGLKGDYATQKSLSDVERAQSNQIDLVEDVMNNSFFTLGRDLADVRAQLVQSIQSAANAAEINALKTQMAVTTDGEKTRGLINDLKYQDLNRALIERNTELVEERHHGRRWFDNYNQAQWAALNSQVQALNSQFADARQGMVNFGTMAGVGQTSTQNQV